MAEEDVGLRVSLRDRRETAAGLRDVDQGLDRVGRSAEASGRRAKFASRGFAALGKAAKVGFYGIAGGVTALAAASVGFVKSAAEDQKSARKLAVSLKNTTGARRRDIKSIENWITAQGKALGVSDDDLRPAISTLATATGDLTKARKLTTLANNIAVGKDKSLASVATALGKAYGGNVAGLARLGVATKDAEGNTLTFDQVQRKLAKTFNGQAAAAADTAAGKYDRFKLALSETGEAIGYRLLPYADRLGDYLTDKGIPLVGRWGDKIDTKVIPAIEGFVRKARPLANEVLPAVADGLGTLRDVAGKIEGPLTKTFRAFNGLPDWAKSAIAIGAGGAVVAKKVGALSLGKKAASTALGVVSKAKPLPVFVTNPGGAGIGGGGGSGGRSTGNTQTTAERTVGSSAGGAAASKAAVIKQNAKNIGLVAGTGALVYGGAAGIGSFLGSRDPADISASQKAAYAGSLKTFGADLNKVSPITISINPATGQPLIKTNQFFDPKVGAALSANVTRPLVDATDKATVLGGSLGKVAKTKVNPKVAPIGFPVAQENTDHLRTSLGGLDRSFTATVDANTAPASAKVDRLLAKLGPVFSLGASVAVPAPSRKKAGTTRSATTTLPQTPSMDDYATDVPDLTGAGIGRVTVVSPVYIENRQIGEAVSDHYRDREARK